MKIASVLIIVCCLLLSGTQFCYSEDNGEDDSCELLKRYIQETEQYKNETEQLAKAVQRKNELLAEEIALYDKAGEELQEINKDIIQSFDRYKKETEFAATVNIVLGVIIVSIQLIFIYVLYTYAIYKTGKINWLSYWFLRKFGEVK